MEKPLWYVNLWMPEQPIHGVVLDDGWRKFAEDILKYYGPWGMAAVLRVTRDEDRSDGAWRTLSHMGEEVVPVLLRELASANLDRHESAINALESVIFRAVRSKGTLQTCRAAIEVVAGNSLESEHTRARAKDLLGWLPRER